MRCPLEPALDHAAHLRELLHQVRLRVQAAGGVDDRDVLAARAGGLDGVVGDRGRVGSLRRADEVGLRAVGPDLELLLGRGAPGVGGAEEDGAVVLAQLLRQLPDRRRLAGAVDADDEDDARAGGQVQRAGLAEHLGDLLRERAVQVGQVVAGLEPAHELGGRADADVALDQRLLEPLPVLVVAGIEGRGGQLAGESAAALAERVAQAAEEAVALLGRLLRPRGIPQQL